jgi:hypothetical protein
MTFKQTLTFTALALSLSAGVALAADAPSNVKSVQATANGEGMTVMWSPVPGAVTYHVYFSHESILGNGGNYDDFQSTQDAQTTYTFATPPLKSPTVFFGVLAVDKDGHESEGFEVEASAASAEPKQNVASSEAPVVETPSSESSSSSLEAMPIGTDPTSTAEPMNMTRVESISSTGVLVTFTKDVNTNAEINASSFLITDASGTVLNAIKTDISGNQVLITTDTQKPDTEYVLGLLSNIQAADGTNATPSEPQVRFMTPGATEPAEQPRNTSSSKPYGRNPNLPGSTVNQPTGGYQPRPKTPFDPSDLSLSATLRKDGTYNVTARWNPSPNADMYSLYTSKNGSAYSWNSAVGKSDTTVQYSRITPGVFGVKVASRTSAAESAGIDKVINLPSSGIGLLGVAAVAGAGAASRMRRKKKVV